MEALTFTFVNGLIPVSRDDYVDFEDFEFYQNPTDRYTPSNRHPQKE